MNSRSSAVHKKKGQVTFDYKNYNDTDVHDVPKHKTMTLDAHAFMRRFLQHIPPLRFRRIRFYGILAGANRAEKLAAARTLLPGDDLGPDDRADDQPHTGADAPAEADGLCPQCRNL